jgi:PAS domain-containing protein
VAQTTLIERHDACAKVSSTQRRTGGARLAERPNTLDSFDRSRRAAASRWDCVWNGFYRDITESKQAEDELKASEERFRRLFEIADAMLLIDDGRFVECNAAAVAMLRLASRDEL